jgi:hypothetical protein
MREKFCFTLCFNSFHKNVKIFLYLCSFFEVKLLMVGNITKYRLQEVSDSSIVLVYYVKRRMQAKGI